MQSLFYLSIHEVDFRNPQITTMINPSGGTYRSVWEVRDSFNNSVALKTLQMKRSFSESNLDGQRLDAITSEKLTSSKYISDIYGYCETFSIFNCVTFTYIFILTCLILLIILLHYHTEGAFSASYEFSSEGGLDEHYMDLDREERLQVAVQVSRGLADLHSLGRNPIIHGE